MDFSKIKNPAIAKRVREEGAALVARCHFGVQGLTKTEEDVKKALYRLLDAEKEAAGSGKYIEHGGRGYLCVS